MNTVKAFVVEDSLVVRASLIAASATLSSPTSSSRRDRALGSCVREPRWNPQCTWWSSATAPPRHMRRKCVELGAKQVFDKSRETDGLIEYCSRLGA